MSTVIARAASENLTCIENVRLDLDSLATGVSDERLARFIAQASARVSSAAGRSYARQTYRQRFEAVGGRISDEDGALALDQGPVIRVMSVKANGQALAPEQYRLSRRSLIRVEAGQDVSWQARNVVVEFEAGYLLPGEQGAGPALPIEVEARAIDIVKRHVLDIGRDPTVTSQSVAGIGGWSRVGDAAPGSTSSKAEEPREPEASDDSEAPEGD